MLSPFKGDELMLSPFKGDELMLSSFKGDLKGGNWGEVQMCEVYQWPPTRTKDDGELSQYPQLCTVDQHV